MTLLAILAAVAVVAIAGVLTVIGVRDARTFRRAARTLGLSTGPRALALEGDVDGCRVVAHRSSAEGQSTTELVVHPARRLPAGLAFGPEGLVQSMLRTVAGGDVTTGDRAFDDAVLVQGDPALVLAVLDAANRRLVRRLVSEGALLDGGELRWRGLPGSTGLTETIRALVRAAKALQIDPGAIPGRLRQRVKRDPLPDVRRRALELLLARFPEAPETAAALETALGDRDPSLRLRATRQTGPGEDARIEPVLRALAADARVEARVREEALDLYIDRLGSPRASPLLVELLDDAAMAPGAAARLARTGRSEALPALCARLGRGDAGARAGIAAAIGRLGDARNPALEAAVLPLLDEGPLRVAAAEALARIGSQRAIALLLPLTEGLLTGGDVKASAQRAIDAIRARRGDGEAGGLSVVEGSDRLGRLSVAGEPGSLSVRPEPQTE